MLSLLFRLKDEDILKNWCCCLFICLFLAVFLFVNPYVVV